MKRAFLNTLIIIVLFILPVSLLLYFLRLYYNLELTPTFNDIVKVVESVPLLNSWGIWQEEFGLVYETLGNALDWSLYDPPTTIDGIVYSILNILLSVWYMIRAFGLYVWYLIGDILTLLSWLLDVVTLYIG